MKIRYLWMAFGLAFFVTLAIIVGQRMSAEAMAVMVGVIAGVAASIPTSLIVVWFATRTTLPRLAPEAPPLAPRPASSAEQPRIVVMAAPTSAPQVGYQTYAGYPAQAYPGYAAPALAQPFGDPRSGAAMGMLPARQFTVIGGTEISLDSPEPPQEVLWQR